MILQKKYSVYFYCSYILILLYGMFALMVLIGSDWDCSGQPKLDSKLGFPSATAGGNPPFAVCGLRQL